MACGCVDTCACFLTDTNSTSVTGSGTSGSPYQITVATDPAGCIDAGPDGMTIDLDPASPAPITCGPDGLSVECCVPCVIDSDTIAFDIVDGCITGEVITGGASGVFPAGMMVDFAGSLAPAGWLITDGSSVPVATYPDLFTNIGYTYGGAGPNFNLPDTQGRVTTGIDPAQSRLTGGDVLGATGGVEDVTLTASESGSPAHGHTDTFGATQGTHNHHTFNAAGERFRDSVLLAVANNSAHIPADRTGTPAAYDPMTTTDSAGAITITGSVDNSVAANAAAAHTNLQPYIVLNKIIKT